MEVIVVGGGLAGVEAAWQVASRGCSVNLYEMRPKKMTKAHRSGNLAELVCSNSLRGASLTNAVGLLKEELRVCNSLIMEAADQTQVPAGGALAVDREAFSLFINYKIQNHPNIKLSVEEITSIPPWSKEKPVIIATGPLSSKEISNSIFQLLGEERLHFYDAISPILLGDSIDKSKIFRQSRYDKGGNDYLNIPLTRDEYYQFVELVKNGEKFGGHEEVEADEISNIRPFEGCMPIEAMIERGDDTLLFGPMKPVGLTDPATGKRPYAVIQLRQDDRDGTLWSMVGFQTRLKHPEQTRIFKTLAGLERAEFVRLGSVHRNTFIDSPKCLNSTSEARQFPGLFFAGQMTGVEGYVESAACGLVAGINSFRRAMMQHPVSFPKNTATGALLAYISDPERKDFQPMNISFGLMPSYTEMPSRNEKNKKINKTDRRLQASECAITSLKCFLADVEL